MRCGKQRSELGDMRGKRREGRWGEVTLIVGEVEWDKVITGNQRKNIHNRTRSTMDKTKGKDQQLRNRTVNSHAGQGASVYHIPLDRSQVELD